MNLIKKSYKYLLLGFLFISIVFSVLYLKINYVKATSPSILLSYNWTNGAASWTSNLSNSTASCTIKVAQFNNRSPDNLAYKRNITLSSNGSGSASLPITNWENKHIYFAVIDCLVDGTGIIHSNQVRGYWDHGTLEDPDWYDGSMQPYSMDLVRVFGARSSDGAQHEYLAPYDSSEIPLEIGWGVQNYNGTTPSYDVPNGTDRDGREMSFTCSFTRSDNPKFIEYSPEPIIQIYNIKKSFEAKVTCSNILSLKQGGNLQAFISSSDTIDVKVRTNPNYNKVLATPVPPLIAFGGTAKIHFTSNGDFCKITEYPLVVPNKDGSILNFSPNWGLTSYTGSGDFPIPTTFARQINLNVTCYTEHSCVGALSADDAQCSVANTQNDCFNISGPSTHTPLCGWNEAPGACEASGPVPPFFPPCSAFNHKNTCDNHPAYCTWKLQGVANCSAIKSSDDDICKAQTSSSDCTSTVSSSTPNICNWGRVSGSTTGGEIGAKNPTTNFLDFAKASIRIYNFSLSMMGNGFIVDTSTTEPEDVEDTTAVLTGEMNPNGQDTELREAKAYFRYTIVDTFPPIFCNDIFGSNMLSTTEQLVGPARTIQRVTATAANLYPNTTYYYCIVGSNNDQITYGGIKSFTTKMTPSDINGNPDPNFYSDKISVTTKSATVVDDKSAYLKGSFNTDISAATWFEYQKVNSGSSIQNINIDGNNPSASIFDFFFKPNIAIAATNTNTATGSAYQWKKVFAKERFPSTNGNFSFLLSGLSPSTTYNFRTVIKDTRFSIIKYGDTLSFTTKSATTSGPRTQPPIGPVTIEPPCKNKLDINCNGTGPMPGSTPETDPGTNTELVNLSDLTASDISASALVVNKPITLSVTIINQGTSSTSATIKNQKTNPGNSNTNGIDTTITTGKTTGSDTTTPTATPPIKIIDNQKRVNPTSIPLKIKPSTNIKRVTPDEINSNININDINSVQGVQGGATTSFFKDIFTTKTAFALTNDTNSLNSGNRTTTGIVNNLNSSGIKKTIIGTSIINDTRTPTGIATSSYPGTSTDGSFYNFFQVSTVNPNMISGLNGNFINLPSIKTGELSPKTSRILTQEYTFPKEGTYYIRACADKKNPIDTGTIQESYEGNNCGQWTTFTIGNKQMCEDRNALNYGTSAPCVSKVGKCLDFSANNYGSPLPCTFDALDNYTDNTNGTNDIYGNPINGNYINGNPINGIYINSNSVNNNSINSNPINTNISNLKLGDTATAPDLAIVRYHEGIETVLQRQIVADTTLAKNYGYQDGADIQSFAWSLADILAKTFGYVGTNGKEIRVSKPDIAAYQLYMNNGILTVYEYYDSKIVNIQRMSDMLRSKYDYEYYFKK